MLWCVCTVVNASDKYFVRFVRVSKLVRGSGHARTCNTRASLAATRTKSRRKMEESHYLVPDCRRKGLAAKTG